MSTRRPGQRPGGMGPGRQGPPGGGGGRAPQRPRLLPPNYLEDGYFVDGEVIKDRLIIDDPKHIVAQLTARDRALQDSAMEYSQLRKFFYTVRQLEYRLRSEEPWPKVRQDIIRLQVHAADAANRRVAPHLFSQFMEQNVRYAMETPEAFLKGFVVHFESVVAYWPRRG